MERLRVLLCFASVCTATATLITVDPRGARPVEHGTRADKCAPQREWPFCTDDDWGLKCPSGCRIEGLMSKYDHGLMRKIEKVRGLLDQNRMRHRSMDQVSKLTYDQAKDKLTLETGKDSSYFDLAQNLRQKISVMKISIDRQVRVLAALKEQVREQVAEMHSLEVDIDIKLRACKGSCKTSSEYQVDQDSYVALDKQMNQLDSQAAQSVESSGTLYVMKSLPLQDAVLDTRFRSRDVSGTAGPPTEDMFPEVHTAQLILEHEGSSSSPATISKVPGTSFPQSSSSSSSSSPSSSSGSHSITELGGPGDSLGLGGGPGLGQPSSSHTSASTSCTTSRRTVVEHTSHGPVERTVETTEGGPGCQIVTPDLTMGGIGALFPGLSHAGGAKGSLLDTKTGFGNPFSLDAGMDLGAFLTDHADDDLPDFQARSLKSARVERRADYVGEGCGQLNQDGRRAAAQVQANRKQRCGAKSAGALCSDDDWVSKCPSGCRLQALISLADSQLQGRLRTACQTATTYQDAAERSMTAMTQIYGRQRRALVHTHVSELKFVQLTEALAEEVALLRKQSSELSWRVVELRRDVREQAEDLYRTEVDVDLNLRACSGSCWAAPPFSADHLGYQADLDQIDQTLDQRRAAAALPRDLPQVKVQPADVEPVRSTEYQTTSAAQRELLTRFEDIGLNRLVLD